MCIVEGMQALIFMHAMLKGRQKNQWVCSRYLFSKTHALIGSLKLETAFYSIVIVGLKSGARKGLEPLLVIFYQLGFWSRR